MQALPLWQKAAAGLTAGGLGALVGSPADLTLIRMQADSTLPMASRRNYKNVGDAMVSPCPAFLCLRIELQWTCLEKDASKQHQSQGNFQILCSVSTVLG